MCQQILQFCSGSTKLLLFAGSLLTLSLAIAIGFIGCTNHAIYSDIDPKVAEERSQSYYLHLAACAYLGAVTGLGAYAAYYDQKHAIRALAVITSVNLVLALAGIVMFPQGPQISEGFEERLTMAAEKYNFTEKLPALNVPPAQQQQQQDDPTQHPAKVMNSTQGQTPKAKRHLGDNVDIDAKNATLIWDRLQARGCCGWLNSTSTWKTKIPKSCCSSPKVEDDQQVCEKADEGHAAGCKNLIESSSMYEMIVLALIALVSLYLAVVSAISTYRTFHYNEASQTAYN